MIGIPTNVKRLHHAEHDENGIKGLPPELQRMLEYMTTEEERQNPDNKDKAKNVLIWMKREEEKNNRGQNFIKGDFMESPTSSGESTISSDSRRSSEDTAHKAPKSTFYIPSSVSSEDSTTTKPANKDHQANNDAKPQVVEEGEPLDNANAKKTDEINDNTE